MYKLNGSPKLVRLVIMHEGASRIVDAVADNFRGIDYDIGFMDDVHLMSFDALETIDPAFVQAHPERDYVVCMETVTGRRCASRPVFDITTAYSETLRASKMPDRYTDAFVAKGLKASDDYAAGKPVERIDIVLRPYPHERPFPHRILRSDPPPLPRYKQNASADGTAIARSQ